MNAQRGKKRNKVSRQRRTLLLLDEPSLGLAPQIVGQVYAALTELKRSGQPTG
jgi:ABC-type branched-subunit amino acid transport system ATPase component